MDKPLINIELVYADSQQQRLYRLRLPAGLTVREVAMQSPVLVDFPQADVNAPLGIFGKRVPDKTIVREDDRVEWYRVLIIDPKEARRQRVTPKNRVVKKP